MSQLLLGNASLLVGLLLVVLVIAIRALARDAQLRGDLRAALTSFLAFALVKTASLPFAEQASTHPLFKTAVVVWMLSFAFGVVRTALSLALWAYRKLTGRPTTRIFRDLVHLVLYLGVALPILKAQLAIDLTSLLATSAILSVVLGLALQDTLGNLFAGLSLQLERPFEVGDFVSVGQHTGRVLQTGWRATRIETMRREVITLTNNSIAREAVKNFTRGGLPVGIDVYFHAAYEAPPNRVRQEVLAALSEIALILKEPVPTCRADAWDENAVKYLVRCYIADYQDLPNLHDELFTRLWYRFSRAGIEIPFPQRVIRTRRPPALAPNRWSALLEKIDLFRPFAPAERDAIGQAAQERAFGRGETVVAEGDQGHTFYIVTRGQVSVRSHAAGGEVARLGEGEYFGEMSLLTGAPRSATVVALQDAQLLEFDRAAFASHFAAHPELAELLSDVLARRKAQLEAASSSRTEVGGDPEQGRILARLRQIFGLRG